MTEVNPKQIIRDEVRIMVERLLFTTKCYEQKKKDGVDHVWELAECMKLIKFIPELNKILR